MNCYKAPLIGNSFSTEICLNYTKSCLITLISIPACLNSSTDRGPPKVAVIPIDLHLVRSYSHVINLLFFVK
jgi:hypothetical protein